MAEEPEIRRLSNKLIVPNTLISKSCLGAFSMLLIAGYMQWRAKNMPCPADKRLAQQCIRARKVSLWIYCVAVVIFCIGLIFAFVLPYLIR